MQTRPRPVSWSSSSPRRPRAVSRTNTNTPKVNSALPRSKEKRRRSARLLRCRRLVALVGCQEVSRDVVESTLSGWSPRLPTKSATPASASSVPWVPSASARRAEPWPGWRRPDRLAHRRRSGLLPVVQQGSATAETVMDLRRTRQRRCERPSRPIRVQLRQARTVRVVLVIERDGVKPLVGSTTLLQEPDCVRVGGKRLTWATGDCGSLRQGARVGGLPGREFADRGLGEVRDDRATWIGMGHRRMFGYPARWGQHPGMCPRRDSRTEPDHLDQRPRCPLPGLPARDQRSTVLGGIETSASA